jgi:hypothetical protein
VTAHEVGAALRSLIDELYGQADGGKSTGRGRKRRDCGEEARHFTSCAHTQSRLKNRLALRRSSIGQSPPPLREMLNACALCDRLATASLKTLGKARPALAAGDPSG